jgi:acyl carrier protein
MHEHIVMVEPATSTESAAAFLERIVSAFAGDRLELLLEYVRDRVVEVLRLNPAEPPGRSDRLMDLGMDSLMAVQLRNLLSKGLAITPPLAATLMFDYPTIDAIAGHLLNRLFPQETAAPVASLTVTRKSKALGRAAVTALSEAEIEARLMERLTRR